MKLGWRDIRAKVSSNSSRVSPRAGATGKRGVEGAFSSSDSAPTGPSRGEPGTGVPGRGDTPDFVNWVFTAFCGVAKRSIVNVRKSSCWSFSSRRMVSNIVEMVRSVVWRTGGLSERASWNRNLHPWSKTRAESEGKSHILEPATSKATIRILSAVSRVESVCAWSVGSRMLMRTRSNSSIDGRPSLVGH